jgi:hypothetical protein
MLRDDICAVVPKLLVKPEARNFLLGMSAQSFQQFDAA